MEQLVRPFELLDPTQKSRIAVAVVDTALAQPGQLCWGSAGQLPQAVQQTQPVSQINIRIKECDENLGESGNRHVERLRVENPDDSDQYVMVERIRQIDFKKTPKDGFLNRFYMDLDIATQLDLFATQFAKEAFDSLDVHDKCTARFHVNR